MRVPISPENTTAATINGYSSGFVLRAKTHHVFDLTRIGHFIGKIDPVDGGVVVTSPVQHFMELFVSETFHGPLPYITP